MPKAGAARSRLTGLIDVDSDEGQLVEHKLLRILNSAKENMTPAKKTRGRPKASTATVRNTASKISKTKAPARRVSGGQTKPVATSKVSRAGKRKALADMTNQQAAEDTEEVDEFDQNEDATMAEADELDASVVAIQSKPKVSKKSRPGRSKDAKEGLKHTDYSIKIDETPEAPRIQARPGKKTSKAKKGLLVEDVQEISETQEPEAMQTAEDVDEDLQPAAAPRFRQNLVKRAIINTADNEKSDPALRRKLGDLNKKLETLETRYRDLKEASVKDAEREFDKLKKQMDEREKVTRNLISSLKADIVKEKATSREAQGLRKKIESQSLEIADLQAKLTQMTASFTEAQKENKTLSTRLTTSRTAATAVESVSARVPGSAVKANGGIRMIGSAEAAQAAQAAQLKEDLYSDLSGLIVRGVKRGTEEDIFDCIQTGRNGTLHFKLSIANEKSADSYEDAQCVYSPMLDPSRDSAMIDLLPDYLTDEITFPRPQAAKFYARVVKALTDN